MSKMVARRFVSEEAVKRALKIDSFRNLSKDKIMQFASMIPYMDKEVAISIINQFPTYAEFGKTIISYYTGICDNILQNSKASHDAAIQSYQTVLDALAKQLEKENITKSERKDITEKMIEVADKVAEADLHYQKFLERVLKKIEWTVLIALGIIGAGIGIHSVFGNSQELPQLEEEDDEEEDDNEYDENGDNEL